MKKIIYLILFFLLSSKISLAIKVLGYDLTVRNETINNGIPVDNYKFRLIVYFTELNFGSMPASYSMGLRSNANAAISNIVLSNQGGINSPFNQIASNGSDCLPTQNSELAYVIYESASVNGAALNLSGGYFGAVNIGNLFSPISNFATGNFNAFINLPSIGNTSTYRYNSAPVFKPLNRSSICVNRVSYFDFSATDANGDSLTYELDSTYLGSDLIKPFTARNTNANYSLTNLFGSSSNVSIDPSSGMVQILPKQTGNYLMAVKVSEFRNGVKIGEVRRELIVFVKNTCGIDLPPTITSNLNTNDQAITIGESLTVHFKIKDSGIVNNIVKFSLKNNSNNTDINTIDTSTYNWTFLDKDGNILKRAKENPSYEDTAYFEAILQINSSLKNLIFNKYEFNLIVEDNLCGIQNKDTISMSIVFIRQDTIEIQPKDISGLRTSSKMFHIKSKYNYNPIQYQWQANYGQGFEDLINNSIHAEVFNDTLQLKSLQLSQHNLEYRCILNGLYNKDTSKIVRVVLMDSCANGIFDTTVLTIIDTVRFVITDTLIVNSTDTLYLKWFVSALNGGSNNNDITIYPNPSSDFITIDISGNNSSDNFDLEIYNSSGQIVYNEKQIHRKHKIDLKPNFSAGVYTIIIKSKVGETYLSKKLIIN
jgi:Secretion system C-terminal sorting domain